MSIKTRDIQKLKTDPNDYPWKAEHISGSFVDVEEGAANNPVLTAFRGGFLWAFTAEDDDDPMYFDIEMPNDYAEGTDIHFHIDWSIGTAGSGAGAENVKWDLTHSWANRGSVFPSESTESVTVDVQDKEQYEHIDSKICEIRGKGKKMGSVLICSLSLDTTVANNYGANEVFFIDLDMLYQSDKSGSYNPHWPLRGSHADMKGDPRNKYKVGAW